VEENALTDLAQLQQLGDNDKENAGLLSITMTSVGFNLTEDSPSPEPKCEPPTPHVILILTAMPRSLSARSDLRCKPLQVILGVPSCAPLSMCSF